MLVSVFLALFLPCAGMSAVFLVYVCLLCYSATVTNDNREVPTGPVKSRPEKGLTASDLEKLPRVAGKDLALGTDCAVCLDEIGSEQSARMIPGCNHGFHVECADAWLSKNSICPVCRDEDLYLILSPASGFDSNVGFCVSPEPKTINPHSTDVEKTGESLSLLIEAT